MSYGNIVVPEEVLALLGEDPGRQALEALLLHLIRTDRASVAWAGEKPGLDRWESVRWYASHGYTYPDCSEEDLEEDLRHAEDLEGRGHGETTRRLRGSIRRKGGEASDEGDHRRHLERKHGYPPLNTTPEGFDEERARDGGEADVERR